MQRPNLLDNDSINIALSNVVDWKLDTKQIIKEFVCSNYAAAVGFINSIAVFAESMDHHPEILHYGWNKLRITITTHDMGGLTELDFKLAEKIDSIKIY